MQQGQKARAGVQPRFQLHAQGFNNDAMLRHRKSMRALGLTIPPRDSRKAMSNVFDLDIHRRRIEQIQEYLPEALQLYRQTTGNQ